MTYVFAAYSVVFFIIYMYMLVQGRRVKQLSRDLVQLQELEQALQEKKAGSF